MFNLVVSTSMLVLEPIIMITCFATFGVLAFAFINSNFFTFKSSFLTILQNTVRGTGEEDVVLGLQAGYWMGTGFFYLQFSLMTIIMLNFFIVFMNDAYNAIKIETNLLYSKTKRVGLFRSMWMAIIGEQPNKIIHQETSYEEKRVEKRNSYFLQQLLSFQ